MIDAMRRSMGVHCVALVGYEVPKDFRAPDAVSGLTTA
jgi:hypothetical protein